MITNKKNERWRRKLYSGEDSGFVTSEYTLFFGLQFSLPFRSIYAISFPTGRDNNGVKEMNREAGVRNESEDIAVSERDTNKYDGREKTFPVNAATHEQEKRTLKNDTNLPFIVLEFQLI